MVRRLIAGVLFAWFASAAVLLGWMVGMAAGDFVTTWQPVTAAVCSVAATGAIACALIAAAIVLHFDDL